MDHVVALRDALHLLGSATDLEDGLVELLTELRRASPSSVGLEVLTVVAEQDVCVSRFLPGVRSLDVITSLEIPLASDPARVATDPGPVRVVFYGGRPGAFVDLAADLAYAQGVSLDRLELDRRRPRSTDSGIRGLERVAIVHRAVGVLMAQGLDPAEAYDRLAAEAQASSTRLVDHAQALVDAAVESAPAKARRGGPGTRGD